MDELCHTTAENATHAARYPRQEVAAKIVSFEEAKKKMGMSGRQAARAVAVAESTMRGWDTRKQSIEAPAALVAFLESPEGVVWLHRLVLVAQLVITLQAPGSIRLVCLFLTLTGLNRFVASSYGTQQKAVERLETELGRFGEQELARLGQMMKPKKITVIEDETFHPEICLVALEAVSGFIFLEMYAANRDADTWTTKLKDVLGQLPVEVIQMTSDEAKALIKHAEEKMKAHHSPDLFHPLHDLSKAMSSSLAARVRSGQQQLEAATQHRRQCEEQEADEGVAESRSDEPAALEKDTTAAKEQEAQADEQLSQVQRQQAEMRRAIRGISDSYHPFDRQTGAVRQAEQVAQDIEGHFQTIDRLAQEISLSQRACARIDKARRVVARMIATISFVHATIRSWVEDLGLPEEVEQFVHESWIPGRYLELAARRAPRADSRRQLRYGARYVAPTPEQLNDILASLEPDQRTALEQVVEQSAQLFQRSSSAVEGRNGHLSLFHHGHHRLPQRKLTALTVVYNFFKVRDDETTAAERLTGHPPTDLIQWLLERIPPPARPARSRRQQAA